MWSPSRSTWLDGGQAERNGVVLMPVNCFTVSGMMSSTANFEELLNCFRKHPKNATTPPIQLYLLILLCKLVVVVQARSLSISDPLFVIPTISFGFAMKSNSLLRLRSLLYITNSQIYVNSLLEYAWDR